MEHYIKTYDHVGHFIGGIDTTLIGNFKVRPYSEELVVISTSFSRAHFIKPEDIDRLLNQEPGTCRKELYENTIVGTCYHSIPPVL